MKAPKPQPRGLARLAVVRKALRAFRDVVRTRSVLTASQKSPISGDDETPPASRTTLLAQSLSLLHCGAYVVVLRPRSCPFESHPAPQPHTSPASSLASLATPSRVLSPAASPPAVRETFVLSLLAPGGRSEARRARAKLLLAAGGNAAGDATATAVYKQPLQSLAARLHIESPSPICNTHFRNRSSLCLSRPEPGRNPLLAEKCDGFA